MAFKRPHASFYLSVDRGIATQERQIPVGSRAGRDLDVSVVLQFAKGADDVRLKPIAERRKHARIPVVEMDRQCLHFGIAGVLEPADVGCRPGRALLGIREKVILDQGIVELLRENRCNAYRDPEVHAFVDEVVERVEQGYIRFGDGFVDPLLSMWPHTGLPGIRQMAMKYEGEGAGSSGHGRVLQIIEYKRFEGSGRFDQSYQS